MLIVGGGDGGTLREVLRHPNVKQVTMIEIDEEVPKTSKMFFPKVSTGFDDPRAEVTPFVSRAQLTIDEKKKLIIQDGAVWVRESAKHGMMQCFF